MIFASCKKVTNYTISDSMKQYFEYQTGSYWIYKNDSTGLIDSTYIRSSSHTYGNKYSTGITEESIAIKFKSTFLAMSYVSYIACDGPNYYTVTGIMDPTQADYEANGVVAFCPNWPPNTKIIPGCSTYGTFLYKTKTADTIDNVPYKNVIYSEFKSTDTSSTNTFLYIRKIYFAKNIGIIKYYEFYPYFKINRSFTMVRYKAIQ